MERSVEAELSSCEKYVAQLASNYHTQEICPYVWRLSPREKHPQLPNAKDTALTILGVTHGNELAGLAVVSEFLRMLAGRVIRIDLPIAVGLGNPAAAKKNQRFIDKDLNRSFSSKDSSGLEGKRAKELEKVLARTYRLLDFHQTTQPCEMPFFIFPYCKQGFEFARKIDQARAVITHWGASFSSEGICTDEFVNENGGIGISYELGQNGFDPYQISLGTLAAVSAYRAVASEFLPESYPDTVSATAKGPIFSWEAIVEWPAAGNPVLDPGWHNFLKVNKGEKLGMMDGKPIFAVASGRILFAKYLDSALGSARRPTELYRVMKEINETDFPLTHGI
jgi:predicted deacylase